MCHLKFSTKLKYFTTLSNSSYRKYMLVLIMVISKYDNVHTLSSFVLADLYQHRLKLYFYEKAKSYLFFKNRKRNMISVIEYAHNLNIGLLKIFTTY